MGVHVTNQELGDYFGGDTEGAIRALKARDPKRYNAMVKAYLEAEEEKRMAKDPFVIMLLMFKGGVGKSALGRIINERLSRHTSALLNLDMSRDISRYTNHEAINFAEILAEEPDMPSGKYIDHLKEAAEYVIIDTPGEIGNQETLGAIEKANLFIMPFGVDQEEEDSLITTLQTTLLTNDGLYPEHQDINILFVLNNYKEQDDLLEAKKVMKKVIDTIENRENMNNNVNISFTHLKYSKAINTMNKTKKSIKDLGTENFVAYRFAKERIFHMMKDVENAIVEAKEIRK